MESLKDSLRVAERAVTQNIFQPKQALYRNLPVLFGEGNGEHNVNMHQSQSSSNINLTSSYQTKTANQFLTQGFDLGMLSFMPQNSPILTQDLIVAISRQQEAIRQSLAYYTCTMQTKLVARDRSQKSGLKLSDCLYINEFTIHYIMCTADTVEVPPMAALPPAQTQTIVPRWWTQSSSRPLTW